MNRMNRADFFDKLATLDEQQLRTALWNVYWRAAAPVRERIEAEIQPAPVGPTKRTSKAAVDPRTVRDEVQRFVDLARSGAYIAGDRRVPPGQRTRWRSEFSRLAADARAGLRAPEPDVAAAALEELIDLACETRHYDYFRSEDPMEAARFVVSDAATLLWGHRRDRHGFHTFAAEAAPQLLRWESPYGWTRSGYGKIIEKEMTLATVISGMLSIPDNWMTFAGHYLDALDHAMGGDTRSRTWPTGDFARKQRAADLAEWHAILIQQLADTEAEDLLDKLADHPALAGPELDFVRARRAHQRGDVEAARALMTNALTKLPGHGEMLAFATGIDAPLPERAREIAAGRA